MKVVRMFTGPDNRTHFEEVALDFQNERERVGIGAMLPVKGNAHIRDATTVMEHFHTAPRRQYLALLSGAVDVISTSGERRALFAGDILQAEDTHGEGHIVRMRGCSRWSALIVPIGE